MPRSNAPLTKKKWRFAEPGMSDILELLGSAPVRATIERELPSLLAGELPQDGKGSERTRGLITELLSRIKTANQNPAALIVRLCTDADELADLSDDILCGRLVFPGNGLSLTQMRELIRRYLPSELSKDLRIDPAQFWNRLYNAQQNDPELLRLILRGDLGGALALASTPSHDAQANRLSIIRCSALLFYSMTARMRAALICRWATLPMTEAFGYDTKWQFEGRLLMENLIKPGKQISALPHLAASSKSADIFEGSFLERSQVLEMAKAIEKRLPLKRRQRTFDQIAKHAQHVSNNVRNLASVTPQTLSAERLGMSDFVEGRLGVSASHAAVLVSTMLLKAPDYIDQCIEAAQIGSSAPKADLPLHWRSSRRLTRTTQWLRLHGRTDRHARSYGNGDVNDKAGARMVDAACQLFTSQPPVSAFEHLRIDPAAWFQVQ
ncbi:MAG: hypothetical protein DI555_20780 [Novosphingobium pentaromativorans]|uniref:Uncharacterized protein n=1 Tax=Novosphingobium pentaromativorans TaxID=205844 RepID=A0A2W5NM38_9SPHN|nr:MAG: hypothetical protein DI555_20780 [Novosphingobium pentaromativorans]